MNQYSEILYVLIVVVIALLCGSFAIQSTNDCIQFEDDPEGKQQAAMGLGGWSLFVTVAYIFLVIGCCSTVNTPDVSMCVNRCLGADVHTMLMVIVAGFALVASAYGAHIEQICVNYGGNRSNASTFLTGIVMILTVVLVIRATMERQSTMSFRSFRSSFGRRRRRKH